MPEIIEAADLFCGGGGTSNGIYDAAGELGYKLKLLAINHWDKAIETHTTNHPDARHLCESLDNVNPRDVVENGHLDLLVASPECTYHSNAAGGVPVNDQSRATAWHVLRWAEALYVDNVLIENVPEFQSWGPLDREKKRIQKLKGKTYLSFLDALRSLGYNVDARVLCCADYGDATTRKRLFIQARRDKAITWPDPTHTDKNHVDLFGSRQPWRPAREIIDWTLKGESIFTRKKPLKPNTMRRILKGLQKFSGLPFVVARDNTNAHGAQVRMIDDPMQTITGRAAFGLCEPYLVEYHGGERDRSRSINEPLPTQDCSNRFGLCEPYIVALNHGYDSNRSYPVDQPMPTITSVDAWGVVEPFLVKYYGSGQPVSIDEPLDTVTARDRFGLVVPLSDGYAVVDILFRMLQPHELAAAMSFPEGYHFAGTREDKVRQIGNAVPRMTAKALCKELLYA